MILRDWRQADAGLVRACYERERRSWRDDLGWDTAWTWATIEHARVTWGLPGLLALDDTGAVRGWSFYMRDDGTLHIGGLVSSSADTTQRLLEAMLATAPAAAACFIRDRAPALADTLRRHGFEAEPYLYLARPLTRDDIADPDPALAAGLSCDSWRDADVGAAARLLRAAYPRGAGRHLAPDGSLDAWTKYVAGVVAQSGCGRLDPAATRVIRAGGELQALALVTSIAPETAHLVQLAVHPDQRGCGVGTALLGEVLRRTAVAGKTALTLLVAEGNRAARRVYAAARFADQARFTAARSQAPAAAAVRHLVSASSSQ